MTSETAKKATAARSGNSAQKARSGTRKKAAGKVKLVKMKCGDRTADVHPDMVEDYQQGGYHKI